jgi:hypothetical protein
MLNNSVSKAYTFMSVLLNKAENENKKQPNKKSKPEKKGLLTRNESFPNLKMDEEDDTESKQQKLVMAYMARIKEAFQEVKDARTNTKS